MTDKTKAVNLTEDELEEIIMHHGRNVADNFSARIERLGYLHKRLKTFNEPEITADSDAINAHNLETEKQNTKADAVTKGWGSTAK